MLQFLKIFFKPKPDLRKLIEEGAVIIDVRTPREYASGHINGSKNIPLNNIKSHVPALKLLNRPIITVCRSGSRSGMAKTVLSANGLDAYNGGSWTSIQ